jgi:CDP-paratose synthetase
MRIVLTGATGFLGSHLAHAFISAGHQVAAIVRASSDTRRLSTILTQLELIDAACLDKSLAAIQPEVIVHTATCYGRHGEKATELLQANLLLPLQLLEHTAAAGSFLFINTDTTLPSDLNQYALSKSQFVEWCRSLANYGNRIANVRLEYVYGPGDDETKFPTQVVRACVRQVPEFKLSPGEQLRDFIYIDDAVAAYMVLLEGARLQSKPWRNYGLGTGATTSVAEFAETAKRESASLTRLNFGALPYRAKEPMRLCAKVGTLKSLGWRHEISLVEGIRKVIASERTHSEN